MYDRSKLSKIDWKYIIIDEAQRMKDRESVLARDLDRYRCQRRLLLTGTPLQVCVISSFCIRSSYCLLECAHHFRVDVQTLVFVMIIINNVYVSMGTQTNTYIYIEICIFYLPTHTLAGLQVYNYVVVKFMCSSARTV